MSRRSVRGELTFSQSFPKPSDQPLQSDVSVAPQTALEVRRQILESLGKSRAATLQQLQRVILVEGHVCDFPLWSYSKQRSQEKSLRIDYEDGSFFKLEAPKGMPGPRWPGYLDVILSHGQRDLFESDVVAVSAYQIFQALGMDPGDGRNYERFNRDMARSFSVEIETDRFRDPKTGERNYNASFRVMRTMLLAKKRGWESLFFFETLFLESLRAGYLKRLDFDYCLHLGRKSRALERFLYGHLLKRLGEKGSYQRSLLGFLRDCGLEHIAALPPKRRNAALKLVVYPALDAVKGKAIQQYEVDDRGNIIFFPSSQF